MSKNPDQDGVLYDQLIEYEDFRQKELEELTKPYIHVTNLYGAMICRLISLLGEVPPAGLQDSVTRDLMADAFDFLFESRRILLRGKVDVAYPLIRRSYESISLMALCHHEKKYAERWQNGKAIHNSEVRKQLGKHPMGAPKQNLDDLYRFFSLAAHPNRDLVPHRFLGDGNKFVLGSIAKPDLVLVTDYCMKHLGLWYWFGAMSSVIYGDLITRADRGYLEIYRVASSRLPEVMEWLSDNFNAVLKESQEEIKRQSRPKFI